MKTEAGLLVVCGPPAAWLGLAASARPHLSALWLAPFTLWFLQPPSHDRGSLADVALVWLLVALVCSARVLPA